MKSRAVDLLDALAAFCLWLTLCVWLVGVGFGFYHLVNWLTD